MEKQEILEYMWLVKNIIDSRQFSSLVLMPIDKKHRNTLPDPMKNVRHQIKSFIASQE